MLEIIEDSILNNLPKLPKKQKEALASYVESAVMAASMQIPYSSLFDNLEASVSSVQIANIQAETKALLELEFNKIQNEYETLALWAGILTVVFLIFSFYSMFKTEELLKQGKQGLSELDDIKERGEGRVADFTERSSESLREFNVRYLAAISEIRDGDARRLDGLEISINKITQRFTEETQKKISVVQKYVENTKKSIDEQYMKMSDSSAKIETKLTEKLGIMDKTIKEQAGMMGRMKQQMDVLQTMVETMKRKE